MQVGRIPLLGASADRYLHWFQFKSQTDSGLTRNSSHMGPQVWNNPCGDTSGLKCRFLREFSRFS